MTNEQVSCPILCSAGVQPGTPAWAAPLCLALKEVPAVSQTNRWVTPESQSWLRVRSGSGLGRIVKLARQLGSASSDRPSRCLARTDGLSYRLIAGSAGLSKNTGDEHYQREHRRVLVLDTRLARHKSV